ncbi:hypothetical protein Leryth_009502 [Lithospermum erythrorhizon]|nr:hypothetical protein Leryth_009502 [Lithospermum erythrorhizon]
MNLLGMVMVSCLISSTGRRSGGCLDGFTTLGPIEGLCDGKWFSEWPTLPGKLNSGKSSSSFVMPGPKPGGISSSPSSLGGGGISILAILDFGGHKYNSASEVGSAKPSLSSEIKKQHTLEEQEQKTKMGGSLGIPSTNVPTGRDCGSNCNMKEESVSEGKYLLKVPRTMTDDEILSLSEPCHKYSTAGILSEATILGTTGLSLDLSAVRWSIWSLCFLTSFSVFFDTSSTGKFGSTSALTTLLPASTFPFSKGFIVRPASTGRSLKGGSESRDSMNSSKETIGGRKSASFISSTIIPCMRSVPSFGMISLPERYHLLFQLDTHPYGFS